MSDIYQTIVSTYDYDEVANALEKACCYLSVFYKCPLLTVKTEHQGNIFNKMFDCDNCCESYAKCWAILFCEKSRLNLLQNEFDSK